MSEPRAPEPEHPRPEHPRPEHPRPQFERRAWRSLNGPWAFAVDPDPSQPGGAGHPTSEAASRDARLRGEGYDRTILVPFCPESELSGVHDRGFQTSLWYHRTVSVPAAWAGKRVLLHFGAVDYEALVYLDGVRVGRHLGGSSSFTVDLGRLEPERTYDLVVHALDDPRSRRQSSGKQSHEPDSYSVFYTRVSGIWQSVWLEAVAERRLVSVQHAADPFAGRLALTPRFAGVLPDDRWRARLTADADPRAQQSAEQLEPERRACRRIRRPMKGKILLHDDCRPAVAG